MPLYVDEAWEYWTADPEVEELLAEASACGGFDALNDRRAECRGWSLGLRFGNGNPDRCSFKLGRERPGREIRESPRRDCKGCGESFRPARRWLRYCCRACVPPFGGAGVRRLADRVCPQCKKSFRPRDHEKKYCGRQCLTESQRLPEASYDAGCCQNCGVRLEGAKRKFCSKRCTQAKCARVKRAKRAGRSGA